jgi:futalosine hydrolase
VVILLVTAVAAERDAAIRDLGATAPIDVGGTRGVAVETGAGPVHAFACGVGPVAAAAGAARLLATGPGYDLVVNAGLGGGFRGRIEVGSLAVANQVTFADLGARTDAGMLTLRQMGLSQDIRYALADAPALFDRIAAAGVPVVRGEILTLATMTATDADADDLANRFPQAIAEGMEGFGVVEAVMQLPGFPCRVTEIRAISNLIGRRDPASWQTSQAFDALATACAALLKEPLS